MIKINPIFDRKEDKILETNKKIIKGIKIAEIIAFSILVLFSVIGMIISGIIVHEYSHYWDYNGEVSNEQICGLNLPKPGNSFSLSNSLGYYSFTYNENDKEKIEEIEKTTEIKAYFVSFLVFLIFDVCLAIVIIGRIHLRKQVGEYYE
jgi:small-conductance mechanosensitive channel